jgi:hypothetical protein
VEQTLSLGRWGNGRNVVTTSHMILAKQIIFPLLSVCAQESKPSYLGAGGSFPFGSGTQYCLNADLVKALRTYLEPPGYLKNELPPDVLAGIKTRRDAYSVFMNRSVKSNQPFNPLLDERGGGRDCQLKFKEVRTFFHKVLREIGIHHRRGRRQVAGGSSTLWYTLAIPSATVDRILCFVPQSKARNEFISLLDVLLKTENTDEEDKIWLKECIRKFVACCETINVNPRIDHNHLLNTNQICGGILRHIGIVPVRMKEVEAIRRVEALPCRRVEVAEENLVDTDSDEDFVVDDNESTNLEEMFSRVNESEVSVNNLLHERMLARARLTNESEARADDVQQKRLLDRRNKILQRKQQRNNFIDDEAAVDDDEDEDDDEDDDGDKDSDKENEFE